MESLAGRLIDCLAEPTTAVNALFAPDTILVQSPGMSQWLKIQIAEQRGIAANLDFPLPSSFIWDLYRQHIADLPEQSAFTKSNMTWKLMTILPGLLSQPAFQSLAHYLHDAPQRKLYQLAHKIADIYDQYLVYRPEWILAWEQNAENLPLDDSLQPWQGILWRALCDFSRGLGESIYHRANLHQQLVDTLQQGDSKQHTQDKPLYVFGLSAIPQQQLEVLSAVAQHREVVIFWFNPSYHYWGDIVDGKTLARANLLKLAKALAKQAQSPTHDAPHYLEGGNPLLASWGKLGRDYQDMLLAVDHQQHDAFSAPPSDSMLLHMQSEIFELQYRHSQDALNPAELLSNGTDFPKIEVSPSDRSLQVHVCHSRMRELEVLHDQLLHCLNENPSMQPGDIIVMMPDVATYAPLIEGVFGSADAARRLPYSISDRNLSQESPLLISFIQLMKLQQSRLSLSEVASILAVPAVLRRFDISQQEYALLQHWLADAGVRWGWDASDKARWALPEQGQNTWLFGLKRLLAGYAMHSDLLAVSASELNDELAFIAPYADIEGQQALALGKFYLFAEQLLAVLDFCEQGASLTAKVAGALALIERLYLADEEEQQDLILLRQAIEDLLPHAKQFSAELSQEVFVSELERGLEQKGVGQRFLAGYVNFCTLMPMRSIPFKVVCLLGMNDSDYPRQSVPVGFDLMRVNPTKRGDRSRRVDDRYLFLEALLSAREQLYISYIGINQKDNSELSPSILLSELLDYCAQAYVVQGELGLAPQQSEKNLRHYLCTHHPLQAFDPRYFSAQLPVGSYNQQACQVALASQQALAPQPFNQQGLADVFSLQGLSLWRDDSEFVLNLDDLVAFLLNPAKAFFKQRWQSPIPFIDEGDDDEEPFGLDNLEKYQLNHSMIERLIAEHFQQNPVPQADPENPSTAEPAKAASLLKTLGLQLRAQGLLPVAYAGTVTLQHALNISHSMAAEITEQSHARQVSSLDVAVQVNIDYQQQPVQVPLVGVVDGIYASTLLRWRSGKLRCKDRLQLYVSWLALCAQSTNTLSQAVFVYLDEKKNLKTWQLAVIDRQQALAQLQNLVALYIQGQNHILHFYPESAWEWLKTADEKKVLQCFYGDEAGYVKGENNEAHIRRICPDLASVWTEFCALSTAILQPLMTFEENA
jgi:exodeoxyribonuclease V gamma subunit